MSDLHANPYSPMDCVCFVCFKKLSEGDLSGGPVVRTSSTARGMGSIPDWRTRILHATRGGPKIKIKNLTSLGFQHLLDGAAPASQSFRGKISERMCIRHLV